VAQGEQVHGGQERPFFRRGLQTIGTLHISSAAVPTPLLRNDIVQFNQAVKSAQIKTE